MVLADIEVLHRGGKRGLTFQKQASLSAGQGSDLVKPRQSKAPESSVGCQWATMRDVPPVETNRYSMPCGAHWEHMQAYVYDRGACTFP